VRARKRAAGRSGQVHRPVGKDRAARVEVVRGSELLGPQRVTGRIELPEIPGSGLVAEAAGRRSERIEVAVRVLADRSGPALVARGPELERMTARRVDDLRPTNERGLLAGGVDPDPEKA